MTPYQRAALEAWRDANFVSIQNSQSNRRYELEGYDLVEAEGIVALCGVLLNAKEIVCLEKEQTQ